MPDQTLKARTAALMAAVVLVSAVSVGALWQSISTIQTALPLDHLMKERDFSALQQDMSRLDRELQLFAADPVNERLDALQAALDFVILRARDNLRVHGGSDPAVVAFHADLGESIQGLELLLAPSQREVVSGRHDRLVVPLRAELPRWQNLRSRAQLLNDEVFQTSIEGVTRQIARLETLRRVLLAGIVLVAVGAAALLVLLQRQRQSYLRLQALQGEVHQLAFQDALTGLANRRLLLDRLEHATVVGERHGHYGALMYLDLDRFKALNDSLGHDVGDQLLVEVAARLRQWTRAEDTVARLGGDEFVVVLENLGADERTATFAAEAVAEKVRVALGQPYQLGARHDLAWHKSASVGVTVFGGARQPVDQLLKQADLALYQAKAAGRDAVRFYSQAMQAAVSHQAGMEQGLRDSLHAQRFEVHYQPIVAPDGRLRGAEALLRWRREDGRLVDPDDFIGIAEDSGLIVPLGQWVLQTVVHDWQRWHQQRPDLALDVAVNVSARQVSQNDFADSVLGALGEGELPPGRLTLELTESAVLSNLEDTRHKMLRLQARGVAFALDDFGTGYGSLTYLRRLPFGAVKIDRSFVRDIGVDEGDEAVCAAIVALARKLKLAVIAEGVESQAQRDFFAHHHPCDAMQGFLYSPALDARAFAALVASGTPTTWHHSQGAAALLGSPAA